MLRVFNWEVGTIFSIDYTKVRKGILMCRMVGSKMVCESDELSSLRIVEEGEW